MEINSENCEAWFLDYYEGNLSKEREEELFAFLALNPELHELFSSYEEVSFAPDKQVHFDWKSELKKTEEALSGINESNYEEYFVSYTEGLLNADEKAEVENFLLQFPAKREELEMLQQAILTPDAQIVFEDKDSLRRSIVITAENFEEIAIASVEGLLNKEEENALATALFVNKEQQEIYTLYQQTKSTPDAAVVFEDKDALKRKERGAFWWLVDTRFAAAAAIALLVGIFYWNYSGDESGTGKGQDVLAKVDTVKGNAPVQPVAPDKITPEKSVLANDASNIVPEKSPAKNNPGEKKSPGGIILPAPVKENKQVAAFIRTSEKFSLPVNANPKVDFSDMYYSYTNYGEAAAPVASTTKSISPGQAAMRWMKKKLDHTAAPTEEGELYAGAGKNVSGFELTSSAVAAFGNVTGANVRLGHEAEGTVLGVGKYELVLSRNN